MMEFFKETAIDFVGKRKFFFGLSGFGVLLGVAALIQIAIGSGNLGIDFAGGAAVQLRSTTPIRIDAARAALEAAGIQGADLQEVVSNNKILIRLKDQGKPNVGGRVREAFEKAFPDNKFTVESSTEIGPTIGQALRKDAAISVVLSVIGIILYIAIRFEFYFGLAAAIATFHDVLVILGIFFFAQKEISLLLVTALLTIAGYSLSDTVVVFDRIRENLRFRRKETFDEVINKSINGVLSRTFITSVTAFLAVLSLYVFGGEVIHDFALAMLMGIVIGTYSSWYIASPLLILLRKDKKAS
jgi:preprotein translocase subunit SecF